MKEEKILNIMLFVRSLGATQIANRTNRRPNRVGAPK